MLTLKTASEYHKKSPKQRVESNFFKWKTLYVSFEKLGEDGWAVRDGDSWTGSMESSLALEDKLTARTMGVRKIEICLLLIQES